jgi:hypothetical protein
MAASGPPPLHALILPLLSVGRDFGVRPADSIACLVEALRPLAASRGAAVLPASAAAAVVVVVVVVAVDAAAAASPGAGADSDGAGADPDGALAAALNGLVLAEGLGHLVLPTIPGRSGTAVAANVQAVGATGARWPSPAHPAVAAALAAAAPGGATAREVGAAAGGRIVVACRANWRLRCDGAFDPMTNAFATAAGGAAFDAAAAAAHPAAGVVGGAYVVPVRPDTAAGAGHDGVTDAVLAVCPAVLDGRPNSVAGAGSGDGAGAPGLPPQVRAALVRTYAAVLAAFGDVVGGRAAPAGGSEDGAGGAGAPPRPDVPPPPPAAVSADAAPPADAYALLMGGARRAADAAAADAKRARKDRAGDAPAAAGAGGSAGIGAAGGGAAGAAGAGGPPAPPPPPPSVLAAVAAAIRRGPPPASAFVSHNLVALAEYSARPEAFSGPSGAVLWWDDDAAVAWDAYPKSRIHFLVLPRPRAVRADGADDLRVAHLPALRRIAAVANAVADAAADEVAAGAGGGSSRPAVSVGVHRIPSLAPLHIHVVSADLAAPAMHTKRHYNSFATDFFLPLSAVLAALAAAAAAGAPPDARPLARVRDGADGRLKEEPVCHRCGRTGLKPFAEFAAHVRACTSTVSPRR